MANERFHAIYVEKAAEAWPLTQQILARYPDCPVIPIRHYKDIFNRPHQDQILQKRHPSLILAVKHEPLIYAGSGACQDFGAKHFYYASLLLNCPFDCDYCFLHGMYPSANLVAFVNVADFAQAMVSLADRNGPSAGQDGQVGQDGQGGPAALLAVSYETDLIALHHEIPYLDLLHQTFASLARLAVQVRTKSADRSVYEHLLPLKNLIIAFSLLPDSVRLKYEKRTPPLAMRLAAVEAALAHGFQVRLCFDPILAEPALNEFYEPFFRSVFDRIDPAAIVDVSYGFFRMPRTFFNRIARQRPDLPLYSGPIDTELDTVSYPRSLREEMQSRHLEILTGYLDKSRIFTI